MRFLLFSFCQTTVKFIVSPPVLRAVIGGSIVTGEICSYLQKNNNLRKQNRPNQVKNTSFFQLCEPDPGESHFLASKDCLQSLEMHMWIFWRSLDDFFFLFIFLFFLWFVNLFKLWNKDLYYKYIVFGNIAVR